MQRLDRDAYHEETERRFRAQLDRVRNAMRKQKKEEAERTKTSSCSPVVSPGAASSERLTIISVNSPKSDRSTGANSVSE